jgi:acetoin utilization protein AcuB
MQLSEIMSTEVATISDTAGAEEAWQLLQERGFHHLVAVCEDRIVGVLSDRDLGGTRGAGMRSQKSVADMMSTNVVTARPGATVKEAAKQMRGKGIGCLPIVDNGTLVGIVTIADLLELLMQGVKVKEKRDRRGKQKYAGPMPGAPRL